MTKEIESSPGIEDKLKYLSTANVTLCDEFAVLFDRGTPCGSNSSGTFSSQGDNMSREEIFVICILIQNQFLWVKKAKQT